MIIENNEGVQISRWDIISYTYRVKLIHNTQI